MSESHMLHYCDRNIAEWRARGNAEMVAWWENWRAEVVRRDAEAGAGEMSDTYELPELPEPDGSAEVVVGQQLVGGMMADVTSEIPAWSEELVREYALLAVQRERERCSEAVKFYRRGPSTFRLLDEIVAIIRKSQL
jgi:hypothetical protein